MTAYDHFLSAALPEPTATPLRIDVAQGALPDDWNVVHDRIDRMPRRLTCVLLNVFVAAATFAGLFAVAGSMAVVVGSLMPDVSPYFLAGSVLLPGLLGGAAAGQAGGNLFLRLWYRVDDDCRRGFAIRLSLVRCPPDWPAPVRRWLFTGDWLGSPLLDQRLPYVRLFVRGAAPAACVEEEALWREIHQQLGGDGCEVGASYREISYPAKLPAWAMDVRRGDGCAELRRRIGQEEAEAWVNHLWRRACRQWPALGVAARPDSLEKECFEMHYLKLSGGRDALAVTLRPAAQFRGRDEIEREERIAAA